MITNLFHMVVPEADASTFKEVGTYNFKTSFENESGTRLMLMMQELTDHSSYWILEMYDSDESYERHRLSPQFQYFVTHGAPLVTHREKLEVTPLLWQHSLPKSTLDSLQLTLYIGEDIQTHSQLANNCQIHFLLQDSVHNRKILLTDELLTRKNHSMQMISLNVMIGFYH